MKPKAFLIATVAAMAGVAAFFTVQSGASDPGSTKAERPRVAMDDERVVKMNKAVGMKRPGFELMDLDGEKRNANEWAGKVLVVNFWATWCPPCRKEMPMFVEMQEKYGPQGLQFVGIALDDETMVRDFVINFQVNYPILLGTKETVDIAKAYGNHLGALPYTVFIDRKGIIQHIRPGEVSRKEAEQVIKKLL